MLFYVVILIINIFTFTNETFICTSNHTVEILSNQIWFFKSSYSNDLNNNHNFCQIEFIRFDKKENNRSRFQIYVTNEYGFPIWEKSALNTTRYVFAKSFASSKFKGHVLFDDWNNDCLYETNNEIEPFRFTNETQKFIIKSYYKNQTRKNPCLWEFLAPPKYGLKVVITNLNLSDSSDFIIENTTEILKTKHNAKSYYPYYNSDNFLKISLSLSITFETRFEFSGYVTVVLKEWKELDMNCTETMPYYFSYENNTQWMGLENYPNNARCKFYLNIPSNTDVFLTPVIYVEKNVDYVQYRLDKVNTTLNNEDSLLTHSTVNRSILFEFISDGSISEGGFEIRFGLKLCRCADPSVTVKCDEAKDFNIMDGEYKGIALLDNYGRYSDNYYCANLHCNFTIKMETKCKNKFVKMELRLSAAKQLSDTFRLYVNDKIAFQNSPILFGDTNILLFISPNVLNIFEVNTKTNDLSKSLLLTFIPIDVLPIVNFSIILDKTLPDYYFIDLEKETVLISVQLSPDMIADNYIMEVYGNSERINFYENENLTQVLTVEKCPTLNMYSQCVSITKKKAVIYKTNTYGIRLFFHASNRNINNCLFNNYIFDLGHFYHEGNPNRLSAISNEKGPCKIYLFFFDSFYLDILTNAKDNNSVIVYGSKPDKIFFKFNKTTAKYWSNIYALDTFLVMEIPSKSSLFMTVDLNRGPAIIDSYPSKTAIKYPLNYINFLNKSEGNFFDYEIKNYNGILNVEKFNISSYHGVFLVLGNETINVAGVKSVNIPADTCFKIYFNLIISLNDNIWAPDVLLYIETVENGSVYESDITSTTTSMFLPHKENNSRKLLFNPFCMIFLFLTHLLL